MGPTLKVSEEIQAAKHRLPGESFHDATARIASALKDNDEHFNELKDILRGMRFLPGGRVQSAMGAPRRVTPYNCFVSQTIHDSMGGIMEAVTEAAETMRLGGGIGYDFSTLRPRGDRIASLDSQASGPISFMRIFDATCATIASAGHRRGAQMGVLRVDHPDIEEFIHAKQNDSHLTAFNVSVGITDEFMRAVQSGSDFSLRWGGQKYQTINAKNLWESIMRSTWDYAEPGVLFIDRINRVNNLWYCEDITATNPCGEQPLPPYGACLLGSFNLPRYLELIDGAFWHFNTALFQRDIHTVVRGMDNVVDRAVYPLKEHETEAKAKRRMGLGITGFANAVAMCGSEYGSNESLVFLEAVLTKLRDEAYLASCRLAQEKGAFPAYRQGRYCSSRFIKTLPEYIQKMIERFGTRNSHLLSIAPTGTISLAADNVSSGIEPVFAHEYERTIQTPSGPEIESVTDYAWREHGLRQRTADECSADDHLSVLLVASKYMDSSVSKTCNVGEEVSWEDFKGIYMRAWEGGAKGCTTFRAAGKRAGILKVKDSEDNTEAACFIDDNGQRHCGD